MDLQKYSKQFEIYYYQIDSKQKATPVTILNFLEETAIAHSEALGLGVQTLLDKGLCWILNRWSLVMDSYPALNEHITIETWPSHFEKFYATRQFLIKDTGGNIIGRAVALWILLNFEKRRPARITEDIWSKYGFNPEEAISSPFSALDTDFESYCSVDFNVMRSDIDTNNHVNNSRYVDWALEAIPQEVFDSSILHILEVEYKKELGYGCTISSQCKLFCEEKDKLQYSHRIVGADASITHSLAKTVWIK